MEDMDLLARAHSTQVQDTAHPLEELLIGFKAQEFKNA